MDITDHASYYGEDDLIIENNTNAPMCVDLDEQ